MLCMISCVSSIFSSVTSLWIEEKNLCLPVLSFIIIISVPPFTLDFDVTGYIAMYATLASRDVDCCLIPESPFYLEGAGGLFEYIEKKIKENGHMVIVIAEGAGQDLLSEVLRSSNQQDASGNKLLQDVGLWISQSIKVCIFTCYVDICAFC